jgi:hypothetical protein
VLVAPEVPPFLLPPLPFLLLFATLVVIVLREEFVPAREERLPDEVDDVVWIVITVGCAARRADDSGRHEVLRRAAVDPALERPLVLAQLVREDAMLVPREVIQPLENCGLVLRPRQLTLFTLGLLPGADLLFGAATLPLLVALAPGCRERQAAEEQRGDEVLSSSRTGGDSPALAEQV